MLDLADADLTQVNASEIIALATSNDFAPNAPRVVIAPRAEQFGLARMYETYRTLAGIGGDIHVCRSLPEALACVDTMGFVPADFTPCR